MDEQKLARIFYQETGSHEEIIFHLRDFHAASEVYIHAMKNNGVIVELQNFSAIEIDLLKSCRTAQGENLLQITEYCKK